MICMGYHLVIMVFYPQLDLLATLAVVAMVHFGGIVSITPSNVGIFEGSVMLALAAHDVPASDGLLIATGLHLSIIISSSFFGLPSRIWLSTSSGKR